jgi:hypothetical protein
MRTQLKSFEVQSPEDLERTFEAIVLGQIDALITVEDYVTFSPTEPGSWTSRR